MKVKYNKNLLFLFAMFFNGFFKFTSSITKSLQKKLKKELRSLLWFLITKQSANSTMLPSRGYFRDIPCPYYEEDNCDRPFCHFQHKRKGLKLISWNCEFPSTIFHLQKRFRGLSTMLHQSQRQSNQLRKQCEKNRGSNTCPCQVQLGRKLSDLPQHTQLQLSLRNLTSTHTFRWMLTHQECHQQ